MVANYVGDHVTQHMVDVLLDFPELPPALGALLRLNPDVELKRPETARRWLGNRVERWRGSVRGKHVMNVDVVLEFAGQGFWLELQGVSTAGDLA